MIGRWGQYWIRQAWDGYRAKKREEAKMVRSVRTFECRSYEQAVTLLRGRSERKVCNNTYLRRDPVTGGVGVYLHGNQIVLFRAGLPGRFSSCGWRTVTTKQRINRCLPTGCHLYQQDHVWYVSIPCVEPGTGIMKHVSEEFSDQMEID